MQAPVEMQEPCCLDSFTKPACNSWIPTPVEAGNRGPYGLSGFQNGVRLSKPRLKATRTIAFNTELDFGLDLF
jgi:hypothetical protein